MFRGFDDPNIDTIPRDTLYTYQFATLLTIVVICLLTASFRLQFDKITERESSQGSSNRHRSAATAAKWIFIVALTILGIEVFKRLYAVGGSPVEVYEQMLGPRGLRDWAANSSQQVNNPVFQLIGIAFPISAMAFGYLFIVGNAAYKLVVLPFILLTLFILVTDGSRTPVVMTLASLIIFQIYHSRSTIKRIGMILFAGTTTAYLTSLMYTYRSQGYSEIADGDAVLVYHQDDSIYRAWWSFFHADYSNERWDFGQWYGTILSNPVPRAIWPGKPLLDERFYGDFKLHYVTNTFFGENAALYGVWNGLIVSGIVALLLYLLLYWAMKLIEKPLGLPVYLICALYVYMALRSQFNITSYIYLPAFALIAQWLIVSLKGSSGRGARALGTARRVHR